MIACVAPASIKIVASCAAVTTTDAREMLPDRMKNATIIATDLKGKLEDGNLWNRDKGKAEFLRMYCHDEDNGKYIGLDNSTGNCLVREFDCYIDLKEWFLSKWR